MSRVSIEDIILDQDRRGISALRPHIPEDFCDQAARLILDHAGTAVIVTGFYILPAGAAETDGPLGAIAIGQALNSIGYKVIYVTDRWATQMMEGIAQPGDRVIEFPITDARASKKFSDDLLTEIDPSVLIAIERCGFTDDGLYRNMRDRDISPFTAKTDYLFSSHTATVGIGDGGNEIGMGELASLIPSIPSLVKFPCITATKKLILASVSNWGGYGLVTALSVLVGRDLLISVEKDQCLLKRLVGFGAVDGATFKVESRVDGFTLEENSDVVARLHTLLADQDISP